MSGSRQLPRVQHSCAAWLKQPKAELPGPAVLRGHKHNAGKHCSTDESFGDPELCRYAETVSALLSVAQMLLGRANWASFIIAKFCVRNVTYTLKI